MISLSKQCSALIAVMLLALGLQSCSTASSEPGATTMKGAGAGSATGVGSSDVSGASAAVDAGTEVGGAFAYFISQNKQTLQLLDDYGVSIMRLGDRVVITIPSQRLFDGYSVQVSRSGNDILKQIMQLLEAMNKIRVTVAAYAEAMAQSQKDVLLTQWQAQTIGNYFWDHGLDARMIYAVGYGGGHPVQYAPNKAVNDIAGDSANYRVQITLKDYVQ